MAENGTVAYVAVIPKCDIHKDHDAKYDARIRYQGRHMWANVCERLFRAYGGQLGTGKGQRLEVRK